MRGDAPRNVHTQSRNLALDKARVGTGLRAVPGRRPARTAGGGRSYGIFGGPDAGQSADALRWNAKVRTSADKNCLQPPNKLNRAQSFALRIGGWRAAQIENRIAYELSRPMKRHIPAAIALKNLNPALG